MDFRDTLSTLMPTPRDDEPDTLRQDIIDELADHLACGFNRELLRGADSHNARLRTLERFGDPAAMARRLWLDAMKGKIMAQRVMIATCVVLMLTCCAFAGVSWHWLNQERALRERLAAEAAEANARLAQALAQSQGVNQEVLKQMRTMTEAVLHPVSADWNPVIFKLSEETADGPPAAGVSLTLSKLEGNVGGTAMGQAGPFRDDRISFLQPNRSPRQLRMLLPPGLVAQATAGQYGGMGPMGAPAGKTIRRTSDAAGIADFGAVQPGDYRFLIVRSWPAGRLSTSGQLNVAPASRVEKSIVCPKTPPEQATAHVRWSWPADLEREHLVLYAPFSFRYRKLATDLDWSLVDTPTPRRPVRRSRGNQGQVMTGFGYPAIRAVLCEPGPGPVCTALRDRRQLLFWMFSHVDANGEKVQVKKTGVWADILTEYLSHENHPPTTNEIALESGVYGLDSLVVLRETPSKAIEAGRKRYDVLVAASIDGSAPTIQLRGQPPHNLIMTQLGTVDRGGPPTQADLEAPFSQSGAQGGGGGMMGGGGMLNNSGSQASHPGTSIAISSEFWDTVDTAFEARSGQTTEWTIPLPEHLIKAVRDKLKAEKARKPE